MSASTCTSALGVEPFHSGRPIAGDRQDETVTNLASNWSFCDIDKSDELDDIDELRAASFRVQFRHVSQYRFTYRPPKTVISWNNCHWTRNASRSEMHGKFTKLLQTFREGGMVLRKFPQVGNFLRTLPSLVRVTPKKVFIPRCNRVEPLVVGTASIPSLSVLGAGVLKVARVTD